MFDSIRLGVRHMARWNNSTIRIMGAVEMVLALILLAPTIIALIYGETTWYFLAPVPILAVMGLVQYLLFSMGERMSPSIGILVMALAWFITFFVIAIPYYLYGLEWYNSIFESVSGFTTTGFTTITDVESLPKSMLFWRSFSQWCGGIAVVLVFMFLLPMMGIGGRAFLNNELSGTEVQNYSVKMKGVAMSFIYIYLLFTILETVLLVLSGVGLLDSSCITMSCLSTGGMSVRNDSMASYSVLVQFIVVVFMFLGGTNFYLHYRTLYKHEYKAYIRSQEFVWTFMWFLIASLVIAGLVLVAGVDESAGALSTLWDSIFTVVSIGTATGFTIYDYSIWPVAASFIFLFLGLFGAMSGSTAGGIKIYRMLIIRSYVSNGFYKMLHPNAIKEVKFDGRIVNSDALMSALVIAISFLVMAVVGIVLLLAVEPDIDLLDSMGLCVSCMSNIGAGLGDFGPNGSINDLSVFSKMILCALMWIGRLEVFMVLILFTRTFWEDVILNTNYVSKHNRNKRMKDTLYSRKR